MCGIAGILKWGQEKKFEKEIINLTKSISHRGPDGEGFLIKDNFAFGHRRLSIIDLEGGKQPMSNSDESIWITYNGEIYNYKELKQELSVFGYNFKTHSDTEVIIYAYHQWGINCVKKLRGMFAFAIADITNQKWFLARDHFGIKPLAYRIENNYLAFSSEISSLKTINNITATGNIQAIDLFLRYQYIPYPHTIYKNVFKLAPAHFIEIKFDGTVTKPIKYWDINFDEKINKNEKDLLLDVEEAIDNSVKAHLLSDVPFGVFLSGGIDSTLITLKVKQFSPEKIKAFTIGFNETEYSEYQFAKKAAEKCNVELIHENITDVALNILPTLVEHYGEPFGDSSMIPTWYVSKLARQHVPLILSGDGGDEFFGGYDSYIKWMSDHPFTNAKNVFFKNPYWGTRIALSGVKQIFKYGTFNNLYSWEKQISYVDSNFRTIFWKSKFHNLIQYQDQLFLEASKLAVNYSRLDFAQYIDIKTYLPCDILTKVDIASMFHGLEVRPPLIDVKVAELASKLPTSIKYRKLLSNDSFSGKYALKKITEKYFNHEFVYRKKQGFRLPIYYWFLKNNKGYNMLIEQLNNKLKDYFNCSEILKLLDNHGKKDQDYSGILWLFLVLGIWLENNKDVNFN